VQSYPAKLVGGSTRGPISRRFLLVPPQNLVERTIVDVSALRAKLAYPDD
jgi:hypothetical protein